MAAPSPATTVRAALKTVLDAEFAADGIVFRNDKLSRALGPDGAVGAIYPVEEAEGNNVLDQITRVRVQLFGQCTLEVDPHQTVDPTPIEAWGQRVRHAVRLAAASNTVWFMRVTRVTYPPDPTGNITRLEAEVAAWGENNNAPETVP